MWRVSEERNRKKNREKNRKIGRWRRGEVAGREEKEKN